MTVRRVWFSLFLAVALVAVIVPILAQEKAKAEEGNGMSAEMMAAWEKVGSPNEHHTHLTKLVGQWKTNGKFWMQPGAEPMASEGKAKNEMIMGGRFLQSNFTGDFMGQPFLGMGLDGFDNTLGKHVGMWIDNAGTMMMSFLGECTEQGKVLTTVSEFVDPLSGSKAKMKGKVTVVNDNSYTYESWSQGPDGEFFKSMEINYSRM